MSIKHVEDICLFLQTDVSSNPPLFFFFLCLSLLHPRPFSPS